MKPIYMLLGAMLLCGRYDAQAAVLSKRTTVFSVNGTTTEQIEQELNRIGPKVESTGNRHAGAVELEFQTRVDFVSNGKRCRVSKVNVRVSANVILPKWRQRKRANRELALIWDTLSSDIKRHEESHIVIAMNFAREIEKKVGKLRQRGNCDGMREKSEAISDQVLDRHDKAQRRFDRIEQINFDRRMIRLFKYRLQQMERQQRRN